MESNNPQENPEANKPLDLSESHSRKHLTFDCILNNSVKLGKYQYIAALAICNLFEFQ